MKKITLMLPFVALNALADNQNISRSQIEHEKFQSEVTPENTLKRNQDIKDNLLRQAKTTLQNKSTEKAQALKQQLLQNQEAVEGVLLESLLAGEIAPLPELITSYQKFPNIDNSLIEWANALLARNTDLNKSTELYLKLIKNFPDNPYLRFQMAETMFYNQDFASAKNAFIQLKNESHLEEDIAVFNKYLESIDKKTEWNFNFSGNYLRDKNLDNSGKPGTTMTVQNATLTYDTPREKGNGVYYSIGADKQWLIKSGYFALLGTNVSGRYYWDNKGYNDFTTDIAFGIGYANARSNWQLTPTFNKRWYGGGVNEKALQRYSNNYGITFANGYWLSQQFKYNANYTYSYDKYEKWQQSSKYNGPIYSTSQSIMYMPSMNQYFSFSLDAMHKKAKVSVNAFNRYAARLGWGRELPFNFGMSSNIGFAKRYYKDSSILGKQENKELFASLSLWNTKIEYKGFMPKFTYSYNKVMSNIPIYSYDKGQFFMDISKQF